jgi:predicted DNA-binding transcriptional regulator AlpA
MASKASSLKGATVAPSWGANLAADRDEGGARRAAEAPPLRLIFKRELLKRIPLSFPTVWKLMRQGRFPRARIIAGKSAWVEHEIDQFLGALPLRPYKDPPEKQPPTESPLSAGQEGEGTAKSR